MSRWCRCQHGTQVAHICISVNKPYAGETMKRFDVIRLLGLVALLGIALFAQAAGSLPYSETANAEHDVKVAVESIQQSNKKLLLIFGANWCPDCRALDQALHGKSQHLIDSEFVVVKIDVGNFDKNLEIAKRYNNPIAKGIPAAVVLDQHQRVVYSTKAGELSNARHMSDTGVYDFFNAVAKASN
jgi:thioredoxin 1